MKKTLLVVLISLILLFGFITLRLGSALVQEGNPIPILTSIMKLELTNSNFQQFSETNTGNRYVSENAGNSRNDIVKEFMKEKGWNYKEQMGSGLVFEKDEKVITVGTRLYSKHYFLWDIPKEVLN